MTARDEAANVLAQMHEGQNLGVTGPPDHRSPMFFSNVIPAFQQPKVGTSSYWSVQEVGAFPQYLEHFGTDWQSIASHMGTKSQTMVRYTTMLAYIPRLEACAGYIPT